MNIKQFWQLAGLVAGVLAHAVSWADMRHAIVRVKPSVVLVGTFDQTHSPRFSLRGTGFIVGDGHLALTNAHVLQAALGADGQATPVILLKGENQEWEVRTLTVLEMDAPHDLALLRFAGPGAPALSLRDSDTVREGQAIAFMGFPMGGALGFSPVTHRGMVSSIAPVALPASSARQLHERSILSLREAGRFDIFQLDATAYPGNSGGPLFDPDTGEVLGIVNMVSIKGTRESALTNPSGISYAIPSGQILKLLQRHQTPSVR